MNLLKMIIYVSFIFVLSAAFILAEDKTDGVDKDDNAADYQMSRKVWKPVFGVSDQVLHKPG